VSATPLIDTLLDTLRASPEGLDSLSIAQQFLRLTNADPLLADTAVKTILGRDPRLAQDTEGRWHESAFVATQRAHSVATAPRELRSLLLIFPADTTVTRPLHISVWQVGESPTPLFSGWLTDPAGLSEDDREELSDALDAPFSSPRETLASAASLLEDCDVLYLADAHRRTLTRYAEQEGFYLSEDSFLLSSLMRKAGISPPRPLSLDACHREVLGFPPAATSARRAGEALAIVAAELLNRCDNSLDSSPDSDELPRWEHLSNAPDTAGIPLAPGVYGFKDSAGRYLYIGKAKSLRRRLASYFRTTEESPDKIEALRAQAYELMVHPCGSELESLVQELRLIRHHCPPLNTQVEIAERKGPYAPIADCIVVLPSADNDKLVTFWFRTGQKISLRSIPKNLTAIHELATVAEEFFFAGPLAPAPSDFPEQEIVIRWLKRHLDTLPHVAVSRMRDAQEVAGALGVLVRDLAT